MNTKLTLLAMLFPLFCFAQKQKDKIIVLNAYEDSIPSTSIYLKDKNIIYQKVFTSSLKQEELNNKLNVMLGTLKSFRFNSGVYTTENEFFGLLYGHKFNVSQDDISLFNSTGYLTFPLDAVVAVQVKDYRYRITVSSMEFVRDTMVPDNSLLIDYFLKQKNGLAIKQSKPNIRFATILNHEFNTLFNVEKSLLTTDF